MLKKIVIFLTLFLLFGCLYKKSNDIKYEKINIESFPNLSQIVDISQIYKIVKIYEIKNGMRIKEVPISQHNYYLKFYPTGQVDNFYNSLSQETKGESGYLIFKDNKILYIDNFKHVNGKFTINKILSKEGDSLIFKSINNEGFEEIFTKSK